jgi:hypothetical protein
MPRRSRWLATSTAAGLAMLLQGCGTVSEGNPSAADSSTAAPSSASQPSTATSATPTGTDLSRVDPCSLVTTDELAQLGLPPARAESATAAGRAACGSSTPDASLGIYVDSRRGLADLNTKDAIRVEERTVGGHQGRLVEKPGGYCDIDLVVTEKSSVTVAMAAFEDPSGACATAERAAAFVEPRIPRG